jgi:metal-responsive CopG/Arc/MetJ family transcriptional regulator
MNIIESSMANIDYNKKERINFFLDSEFAKRVNDFAEEYKISVSEMIRKALDIYIKKIEKEKIEKELESGYKSNYEYYLKSGAEWQYAEKGQNEPE